MATNREKTPGKDKMIGNQFWKLASTHGREKIFKTPEQLWAAATEYFEWCDNNPFLESVVQKRKVTRDTEVIDLVPNPKMRPYTIQGLCLYLNCNSKYIYDFEDSLKGKDDKLSRELSEICTRIRDVIYNQKFSGAASGFFNANIIARDLGLSDKQENKVIVEQPLFDDDGEDQE